jgi:hypothetical protein
VAAWSLAGCTGLVQVAALVLLALNAHRISTGRISADVTLAAAVGLYAVTGRLIVSRLPRNAIGWLLSLIGLSVAASMFSDQYALYGLSIARGAVPAARLVGWCGGTFALLAVMLLVFLVVLFPDGRLPSRRWRPVLWLMFAVVPGWLAVQLQAGTAVSGGQLSEPAGDLPAAWLVQRLRCGDLQPRGGHPGAVGGLGVRPAPRRGHRAAKAVGLARVRRPDDGFLGRRIARRRLGGADGWRG